MNQAAPAPKARDWIAVDQLVQRTLSEAPDDFERDVIRLALETTGGPDPDVPGGGAEWTVALDQARRTLRDALAEELDQAAPVITDNAAIVESEIRDALAHVDINQGELDDLVIRLGDLGTRMVSRARETERQVIADWLFAWGSRLGTDSSVILDAQSRALLLAAERLGAIAAPVRGDGSGGDG